MALTEEAQSAVYYYNGQNEETAEEAARDVFIEGMSLEDNFELGLLVREIVTDWLHKDDDYPTSEQISELYDPVAAIITKNL